MPRAARRDPRRPGPAPAGPDAELLTIALVRHLPGRRSENGFRKEIRRNWGHLFPHLPDQPEVNRRTRWLWGAFGQLRAAWAAAVPAARSSRSIPPRCRSSTPPGSAAQTSGPAPATAWPPGSAATARTPNVWAAYSSWSLDWQRWQ